MKDLIASEITSCFLTVLKEQNPTSEPPLLESDTVLLKTGLDSLGFAILVVRLEERLGFDPFVLSEDAYYPKTFGDFVDFYRKNQTK